MRALPTTAQPSPPPGRSRSPSMALTQLVSRLSPRQAGTPMFASPRQQLLQPIGFGLQPGRRHEPRMVGRKRLGTGLLESYSAGPPACVTASVAPKSSPRVTQLTGTVFAVALSPASGAATAIVVTESWDDGRERAPQLPGKWRADLRTQVDSDGHRDPQAGERDRGDGSQEAKGQEDCEEGRAPRRQDDHTRSWANPDREGCAQPVRHPPAPSTIQCRTRLFDARC